MDLSRGDVVVVSASGDHGKPRPAVVLQADVFSDLESVVVALMTSEQREIPSWFRISIEANESNGLRAPSDVMVDKLFTFPLTKVDQRVGALTATEMRKVSAALGLCWVSSSRLGATFAHMAGLGGNA